MVLLQKWPFFQLSFLGNIGQDNVFYDILERENASLGYKNKKFKKLKGWHFSKGITHGFAPKMAVFPTFFFRQYRPVNCLYDIQGRKNAFLGFKTKKFKKSKKIDIFPKGLTHGFGIKIGIFRTFFLKQSRPGKCFFTIF